MGILLLLLPFLFGLLVGGIGVYLCTAHIVVHRHIDTSQATTVLRALWNLRSGREFEGHAWISTFTPTCRLLSDRRFGVGPGS